MKILLPNPRDFLGREELFFDQLELCIFHAKKAWGKVKSAYSEGEEPWLSFNLEIESNTEVEAAIEKADPDFQYRQEVSIEINEP